MSQRFERTGYVGDYSLANVGQEVSVVGWVDSRRNLGALIFVYLRDRTGILQLVFDEEKLSNEHYALAESLRNEFVISVKGVIAARAPEVVNPNVKTGEIEVIVHSIEIISIAKTPPFEIEEQTNVREELRLAYRYLDLRRAPLQKNLMIRHKLAKAARDYYADNGFLEIETPMLTKSTPEGARDYLVPSRVHPGKFFALPQSPQLFKQLLMLSGFDRYMQITKCFRDEDLRADRQPEFTQIDLEMSFVDVDDVIEINEGFLKYAFQNVLDIEITTPFKRLTYQQAMERFGSDKPDTRFGLELIDLTDIAANCGFTAFASVAQAGGTVRAINVKQGVSEFSRKEIDALVELIKLYGGKGMAWISMKPEGVQSSIMKFFSEDDFTALLNRTGAETGDIIFIVADQFKTACECLGQLRLNIGNKLNLIPKDTYNLLWVTDFPLFEYSEEENRYFAMHHPFTSPTDDSLSILETDPAKATAKAYDCVLNGSEIGGGSIRIHSTELQQRMFQCLGFSDEEAWERFGFLLEAFKYGTPPHGGLAFGLDRLAMIFSGTDSIRDVIAFPKVQNASCMMTQAPSEVSEKQLQELSIQTIHE